MEKRKERLGKYVVIFMRESDTWQGELLHLAIVEEARNRGISGVTVVKGIVGFGASYQIHSTPTFNIFPHLPIIVQIVDTVEKIDSFLHVLCEMAGDNAIISWEVRIENGIS